MRVSELDSIAIEGIDYQQSRIKTHGKGDKYRCVPIGPDTAKVINRWINCPTTMRITHLRIAQHIAHRVSPGGSTWQRLFSQTGTVRHRVEMRNVIVICHTIPKRTAHEPVG
jgi:site-specific recombinase XerC